MKIHIAQRPLGMTVLAFSLIPLALLLALGALIITGLGEGPIAAKVGFLVVALLFSLTIIKASIDLFRMSRVALISLSIVFVGLLIVLGWQFFVYLSSSVHIWSQYLLALIVMTLPFAYIISSRKILR